MSEELYRKLLVYNTWWQTGKVKKELTPKFRRELFKKLIERIKLPRIQAILGPRRVGKTTMMFQLIEHLLGNRVSPEHILYASLDGIEIKNIDALISTY